jgi:hypothetical protein
MTNHSADLVVVAQVRSSSYRTIDTRQKPSAFQAFHWCPDYDAAAAEFARILKPGGIVALIWNLEDRFVCHSRVTAVKCSQSTMSAKRRGSRKYAI